MLLILVRIITIGPQPWMWQLANLLPTDQFKYYFPFSFLFLKGASLDIYIVNTSFIFCIIIILKMCIISAFLTIFIAKDGLLDKLLLKDDQLFF